MFKFVHAADLHLDSPFKGISSKDPNIGEILCNSTFRAFEELIKLCMDEDVDFLIVSGDVYESALRSLRAQLRFMDGLSQLDKEGIKVYIACGNHDPYDEWNQSIGWSQNVHFFSTEKVDTQTCVTKSGAKVLLHGRSYKKRDEFENLATAFKSIGDSFLYEIGVLHCNVGGYKDHGSYAPCSKKDLVDAGMNYWALGHIHKREIISEDPYIVYPGNIQGRHINEPGEKGCYLVNVDSSFNTSPEFRRLDVAAWQLKEVDITDAESLSDIEPMVEEECLKLHEESSDRFLFLRLILKGRSNLVGELRNQEDLDKFYEEIKMKISTSDPSVYVAEIISDIKPVHDLESLLKKQEFLGDLLRAGKELRENHDLVQALDEVFEELYSNDKLEKILEGAIDQQISEKILQEAEFLCVDRLLE